MEGSYNYTFINDNRICQVEGSGEVTVEMTFDIIDRAAHDPLVSKNTRFLINVKSIYFHPTYRELMLIKNHLDLRKTFFQNDIALVVPLSFYHVSLMICEMSSLKMKTFKDYDKAYAWLEMKQKIAK